MTIVGISGLFLSECLRIYIFTWNIYICEFEVVNLWTEMWFCDVSCDMMNRCIVLLWHIYLELHWYNCCCVLWTIEWLRLVSCVNYLVVESLCSSYWSCDVKVIIVWITYDVFGCESRVCVCWLWTNSQCKISPEWRRGSYTCGG